MITEFSQIEQEFINREYEPFKNKMLHKSIDMHLFLNLIIAKAITEVGIFFHQKTRTSDSDWTQISEEEILENLKLASEEYYRSNLIFPLKSVKIAYFITKLYLKDKNDLSKLKTEITNFTYNNYNEHFIKFISAFDKNIFNKLSIWCFDKKDIEIINKFGLTLQKIN